MEERGGGGGFTGNGVVSTVVGPGATVAVAVIARHGGLGEEGEGLSEDWVHVSIDSGRGKVEVLGGRSHNPSSCRGSRDRVGCKGRSFEVTIEIAVARFGRHVECYPGCDKDCAEGDEVGESGEGGHLRYERLGNWKYCAEMDEVSNSEELRNSEVIRHIGADYRGGPIKLRLWYPCTCISSFGVQNSGASEVEKVVMLFIVNVEW